MINRFLQTIQKHAWLNRILRYVASILTVLIAFWLYWLLTVWFGSGLSPYLLFFPAVIIVALLVGFGPGLLATVLAVMLAAFWILPPEGFTIGSPIDQIGAVLFSIMGLIISSVAELYRRNLKKRERELIKAVEELKRSNKELRQFTYVSSHDLQEPLRTIVSFTQLLERRYKGKLDSDADEFIDYIVEAAKRMKQQIEDLLEFSRITTVRKEFKPVDMNLILNQTIQNLNASIKESKAEIIIDELPTIFGDGEQLQRVFQNIISNAIKFKKPGEPPIIHISSYKDKYNPEYVFSVKDNGIGIEEQYTERIFIIFQRLHTIEEYKGTGIGLSMVKKTIEHHGGRVWVKSEFGVGSTFYFTIPFEPVKNE